MTACPADRAPFRCPSFADIRAEALALLPRGRAWSNHDGGPWPTSTLYRFWSAVAESFHFAAKRLCDLRLEFWCATHVETHDLWMAEYGLPDPCDPFPDLCTKVAAIGGTRCEYYQEIVARAGWRIECAERQSNCGAQPGCAQPGCMQPGSGTRASEFVVIVNLPESPAYVGGKSYKPQPGCMQAGDSLGCGPNIRALECLMARMVHAQLKIVYEVIE